MTLSRQKSVTWLPIAIIGFMCLQAGCQPADPDPSLLRVAALTAPGTPWHDGWLSFQERVEADPATRLDLEMFVNGQLGSEESTLSSLRRGRIQMGGYSLHGLSTVVPELGVLLAPYLFESREEVDYIVDHHLSDIFEPMFADKGIELLRWSEVGWSHIYCRGPVLTPEDLRSVKVRASSAAGSQAFLEAIGADNIPVVFAEVIPALQTGLIDCGQGGIGMYAISGIARAAPHLTLTYHAFDTGLIIANQKWLGSLPDDQRAIVLGSLEPTQAGRERLRGVLDRLTREELPAYGVTFHALSDAERQAWREAIQGAHEDLLEKIGGRAEMVYSAILDGKRSFRQRQRGTLQYVMLEPS